MFVTNRPAVEEKLRIAMILVIILFPTLTNLVEHTGSAILIFLTAAGLPILFCARLRPDAAPHEKWVLWAFAAYVAVHLLSFGINGMLGHLADPRFRHLDRPVRFLAVVPLFFLFRHIRIPLSALWTGILIGAGTAGGYALINYIWLLPGERVAGSYHPIAFGHVSLALAFMCIPALDVFKHNSKIFWLIPVSAFALGMTASILSETRGAWIAIPALTVILFYYAAPTIRLRYRLAFAGIILISLIAVYQMPNVKVAERVQDARMELNAYRQGDRTYSSIASRIEGWIVSLKIFKDNPIIGAGPGNYSPLRHRIKTPDGKKYVSAAVHNQPHGIFPLALADIGILGLAGLLGIFILPLMAAVRCIRGQPQLCPLGYAWMILVVSFIHFGLTETIFIRNVYVTFYIILTALIMAVAANTVRLSAGGIGKSKPVLFSPKSAPAFGKAKQ